MAALTLVCKCCGARVFIVSGRKGRVEAVSMAEMTGWRVDTENIWRCAAHFQTEITQVGVE